MYMKKAKWLILVTGLIVGVGLTTGVTVPTVQAATQVSTANQTSTVPTLADAAFEQQIQAPIPDGDTIEQAFPNAELRQAVAYALQANPTDNLKKTVDNFRQNENWLNRVFVISPDSQGFPTVTEPILNWTGMSALKDLFGVISVDGQPDFDHKAAKLVQCIGSTSNPLDVDLLNDDLTTSGFNELAGLRDSGIVYDNLNVSQNQITDFSAIDKLADSGVIDTVQGLPERGSVRDQSALSVSDGRAVIKGGVPGATFLPKTLAIDPTQGKSFQNVGMFRLETPAQTASFNSFSGPHLPDAEPIGALTHPITQGKIDAFNQVDFNNHEWHYIFPWYRALTQITELEPGDMDPTTINVDQLKNMDIQGIPADASSVRVRTLWANYGSQIMNSPYTTLVDIPLTHGNKASSSASTMTSAQSTVSGASLSTSSAPAKLAVKGQAVYALKKVGLYRQPTFTTHTRRYFYPRRPRIRRPQFVVTGYGRSKQGRLRYRVRDVNHASATFGRQGYVTTVSTFITKTYYQRAPKRIRVINRQGVNAYRNRNLTKQVSHYRRGRVLKVAKVQRYHLTTRLVLPNGRYVTANKTLVKASN